MNECTLYLLDRVDDVEAADAEARAVVIHVNCNFSGQ